MADITLGWMIDQCRPFIEFDDNFLWEMYDRHQSKLEANSFKYACGPLIDSFAGFQKLSTSNTRTPGQYNAVDSTTDVEAIKERTNEYFHPSVRLRYEEEKAMGLDTTRRYKESKALAGFSLIDHREKDSSGMITSKGVVNKDPRSSGVVWEKAVGSKMLRISEWQIRPNTTCKEYISWMHDENKKERARTLHSKDDAHVEADPKNAKTEYRDHEENSKRPLEDLQFYGEFSEVKEKEKMVLEGSFELAIMGKTTWASLADPVKPDSSLSDKKKD